MMPDVSRSGQKKVLYTHYGEKGLRKAAYRGVLRTYSVVVLVNKYAMSGTSFSNIQSLKYVRV